MEATADDIKKCKMILRKCKWLQRQWGKPLVEYLHRNSKRKLTFFLNHILYNKKYDYDVIMR